MEILTVKNGGSEVNTIGIKENRDIPYVLPSRRYVQYDMNSDNDFLKKEIIIHQVRLDTQGIGLTI